MNKKNYDHDVKSIIRFATVVMALLVITTAANANSIQPQSVQDYHVLNTRMTIATVVSSCDGLVTLETPDGNIWEYEGGTRAIIINIIFDTQGTPAIEDDSIVSINPAV